MLTRREQEGREPQFLAPCAVCSAASRGRRHSEKEHEFRSRYQRDRDRIVHSTAFRRMEYKTQVFVNHEGDHYRTRLTHTMEVAQISRTIARALALNEDLVEALALGHDLGHTPFGHTGERVLDELLRGHGEQRGFEHNAHGLRVVDLLERRYPQFEGLNLSYEVREGFAFHCTTYDSPAEAPAAGGAPRPRNPELAAEFDHAPSLEVQVVSAADEIAYDNHDLDDGLESGLIDARDLEGMSLWREATEALDVRGPQPSERMRRAGIVRYIINLEVQDLLAETSRRIGAMQLDSLEAVRAAPAPAVGFSAELAPRKGEMEAFLMSGLYRHWRVERMSNKARLFIESLFNEFAAHPELLPPGDQSRLERDGAARVAADYIAGMTDRYAQEMYKQLFYPFERT
jgi:dGTPase